MSTCRLITSPITKEEVTSKTWEDIREAVGDDDQADDIYLKLTSPDFLKEFGDWINYPENVADKINDIGEPTFESIKAYPEIINFNRPITFQEQQAQFLDRFNLKPYEVQGEKGYRMTKEGAQAMSKQLQKSGWLYNKLSVKYSAVYGLVQISPKEINDLAFNREIQEQDRAKEIVTKVLDKISETLGVNYEIISADQAKEITKDSKVAWNGEGAFFYGGKAYLLDSAVNLTNGIHELSHPFIDAIAHNNKPLFDKLYSDFRSTSTGDKLDQAVREQYKDFPEDQIQKEVIVRALTAIAEKKIDQGEEAKVKSIILRFWVALKNLLRKVFGSKIELANLNENTNLDQLADMLTGEHLQIDTQVVKPEDLIEFNRAAVETIKDIEAIGSGRLVETVDKFHQVISQQLNRINKNSGYKDLQKLATNEADRNQFRTMKELLDHAMKIKDSLESDHLRARQLAHTIQEIDLLSGKILDHTNTIVTEAYSKENLSTLTYYNYILSDWGTFIKELTTQLLEEKLVNSQNSFLKDLNTIKSRVEDTQTIILKNSKYSVLGMLAQMLGPLKSAIENDHQEKIAKLKEDLAKGNKSAAQFIKEEEQNFKNRDLSEAGLLNYLKGDKGDTNAFSAFLEAYISSPDPIVGGFAKFLQLGMYEVQDKARDFSNRFRMAIDPMYKKLGVNRAKVSELADQLTFVDTVFGSQDGKPVKREVLTFLNQFKNWRYDDREFDHTINNLRAEGKDDEARRVEDKYREWKRAYMNQEYKDEVYQLQDIWNSETGKKAKELRSAITNEIRNLDQLSEADPSMRDEYLKQIKLKWRDYAFLGSLYYLNGQLKVEGSEDYEIAKVIREYQQKSKDIYEDVEKKGLFETRYNQAKQSLVEEGLVEGSDDYNDKLNNWIEDNTRIILTEEFYSDRQALIDTLKSITAKIPDNVAGSTKINEAFEQIIDLTKGFRDEDGQPIGTEMSSERIEKIKKVQEAITDMQKNLTKLSGLTPMEQADLNFLHDQRKKGIEWNEDQKARVKELYARKNKIKEYITPEEFTQLQNALNTLKSMQSKIPTEYYLEVMNDWMSKMDLPQFDLNNAEDRLEVSKIDPMFENKEFKEWFLKNHLKTTKWNPESKTEVPTYQRIYVWSKIIPVDSNYFQNTKLSDGTVIRGVPSREYFRRQVKKELRTERVIGKTINNRGEWLPKTMEAGAKDATYINERYDQLRSSNPDMFKLLETYTQFHQESQEGLTYRHRLWMDVPRYRKDRLQYLQGGTLVGDAKSKASEIKEGIVSLFASRDDDFAEGEGNFNPNLVSADLFDNEISEIPITGTGYLPLDQVSRDIGGSILHYMLSAEKHKKLSDMNPMAKALINTVEDNGIKDPNSINKSKWMASRVVALVKNKKGNNVRAKILNNLYERAFLGIEHHNELGSSVNKAVNQLMGLASWGSLALDLPGGVKNLLAGRVQNFIETLNGRTITYSEYLKGTGLINSKFIPSFIADFNKLGEKTLESQLFDMFDVIEGKTEENFGKELSASNTKHVVDGKWAFSTREYGEIEVQGSFWAGMMLHVKVKQTIDGVTKEIPYLEAWEKVNGQAQLKQGIDPKYGIGGEAFTEFKLKYHETTRRMQGNYAKENQPEISRYTTGRLIGFMRKYLAPAAINRFSKNRMSIGLAEEREGYYVTSLKVAGRAIRDAKLNWHLYSDKEKANVFKFLTEVTTSIAFYLALRALGWDSDDKDKIKKLADNSWLTNHLLYQIMAVKSESEQFIPIPGMGLDELIRIKNQPSIAFPMLDKYYKIIGDTTAFIGSGFGFGDTSALKFKAKSGIWDKGDYKFLAHSARVFGLTGTTLHPEVAIKNYSLMQTNPSR